MFNLFNLFKSSKSHEERIEDAEQRFTERMEKKNNCAPPEPTEKEKPATIFYRFGITDNNRVSFQVGYSEITMSKQGVQNLIDQLTFFRDQLDDEEDARVI